MEYKGFRIGFRPLKYREFLGFNSNGPIYSEPTTIDGIRIKGQIKVTTDNNNKGEQVTCNIVYRVGKKVPPDSMIEDRLVMECRPLNVISVDTDYLCYMR